MEGKNSVYFDVNIQDFFEHLKRCSNVKFKSQENKKKINYITKKMCSTNTNIIRNNEGECWLPPNNEDEFFQIFLGHLQKPVLKN